MSENLHESLLELLEELRVRKKQEFDRKVPIGDLLSDRYEHARKCGFGEGTTCFDNVHIIGDVKVGKNTYIGPNVYLDGTGGLEIGDYCSIGAGVQIYTHNSLMWALSMGKAPYVRKPTKIGSGVYICPNTIIAMGLSIGDCTVIGSLSMVVSDIPPFSKAWGTPAKVHGSVAGYFKDAPEEWRPEGLEIP